MTNPEIVQLVESMEGRLSQARGSMGERAFGLGCSSAGTPVLVIVGLAYILGARSWVSLALVLVVALMAAGVLISMLTTRAQMAAARRLYDLELLPELRQYSAANSLTLEQIGDIARTSLPKDAYLSSFLPDAPAPVHEE